MTLTQVRRIALALPETEEKPHFDRISFRVRNRIFVTALPGDGYINVLVGENQREPVLALHPEYVEKLFWGKKLVGLRVAITNTPVSLIKELIKAAWETKAPQSLRDLPGSPRK